MSSVTYSGNGSLTDFTVTFPYVDRDFVKVSISGAPQTLGSDYNFISATEVRFVVAPPAGVDNILITRETSATPVVDFVNGSPIDADALDLAIQQSLHIVEEQETFVSSEEDRVIALEAVNAGPRLDTLEVEMDEAQADIDIIEFLVEHPTFGNQSLASQIAVVASDLQAYEDGQVSKEADWDLAYVTVFGEAVGNWYLNARISNLETVDSGSRLDTLEAKTLDPTIGNDNLDTRTGVLEARTLDPTIGNASLNTRTGVLEARTLDPTSGNASLNTRTGVLEGKTLDATVGNDNLHARTGVLEGKTLDATIGNDNLHSRTTVLEGKTLDATIGNDNLHTRLLAVEGGGGGGSTASQYLVVTNELTPITDADGNPNPVVDNGPALEGLIQTCIDDQLILVLPRDRFWIGTPMTVYVGHDPATPEADRKHPRDILIEGNGADLYLVNPDTFNGPMLTIQGRMTLAENRDPTKTLIGTADGYIRNLQFEMNGHYGPPKNTAAQALRIGLPDAPVWPETRMTFENIKVMSRFNDYDRSAVEINNSRMLQFKDCNIKGGMAFRSENVGTTAGFVGDIWVSGCDIRGADSAGVNTNNAVPNTNTSDLIAARGITIYAVGNHVANGGSPQVSIAAAIYFDQCQIYRGNNLLRADRSGVISNIHFRGIEHDWTCEATPFYRLSVVPTTSTAFEGHINRIHWDQCTYAVPHDMPVIWTETATLGTSGSAGSRYISGLQITEQTVYFPGGAAAQAGTPANTFTGAVFFHGGDVVKAVNIDNLTVVRNNGFFQSFVELADGFEGPLMLGSISRDDTGTGALLNYAVDAEAMTNSTAVVKLSPVQPGMGALYGTSMANGASFMGPVLGTATAVGGANQSIVMGGVTYCGSVSDTITSFATHGASGTFEVFTGSQSLPIEHNANIVLKEGASKVFPANTLVRFMTGLGGTVVYEV
jgi:hypothetical protein